MESGTFRTGHVGLNVSDVGRSADFYARVFGFEVVGESREEGRRFAMLRNGDALALTLWQQSEGRFDAGTPGLHHLSFQVESMEKVEEAERRLREIGVELIYGGVVPHGEGTASGGVFFTDPDGIRLEIFAATGAERRAAPAHGGPSCGFF